MRSRAGTTKLLGLEERPFGFYAELRPKTASIVYDFNRYTWHDQAWMAERAELVRVFAPHWPFTKFTSAPGDDGEGNRVLTYRELAEQLVDYVAAAGLYARRTAAGDGASAG